MNMDFFDCKSVTFNHRSSIIVEGEKEVDVGGVLKPIGYSADKPPTCTELRYHPEGPKPCVEARFDNGTIRFIHDYDEVAGEDVTPDNVAKE